MQNTGHVFPNDPLNNWNNKTK